MADQTEATLLELDLPTRLAIERTRISYDGNALGWIRTATSLITFGFSIYKFFQMDATQPAPSGRVIGPREFGVILVSLGLVSLALATWENRKNMDSLRALGANIPYSRATGLAGLIGLLGILALVVMILRA
jgi:putative membrane protein